VLAEVKEKIEKATISDTETSANSGDTLRGHLGFPIPARSVKAPVIF